MQRQGAAVHRLGSVLPAAVARHGDPEFAGQFAGGPVTHVTEVEQPVRDVCSDLHFEDYHPLRELLGDEEFRRVVLGAEQADSSGCTCYGCRNGTGFCAADRN